MRRETEAFLDLVRDAEDPTRADEARVQRALRAAIAAGVAPSVEPSLEIDGSPEGTYFGDALARLGLSGAKLNLLAVCAAASLATGDTTLPIGAHVLGEMRTTTPAVAAAPLDPGAAEPSAPEFDAEPVAPPFEPEAPMLAPSTSTPSTQPPGRAKPRARAAAAPAAPVAASSLRAELELLQRVQAALKRGEASSALRALDAHRTTDTTLLAERRAARILALCQLGQIDDARRAAADFVKQHPDSLQRAAVDGSCANR